jgi:sec-independent protein translocase protein TatA
MPDLGPMELAVILLIVVMIFGAGKLPQAATSLGKAIREFKKSSKADDSAEDEPVEATPRQKAGKAKIKPAVVAAIDAEPATATEPPAFSISSVEKPEPAETPIQAA